MENAMETQRSKLKDRRSAFNCHLSFVNTNHQQNKDSFSVFDSRVNRFSKMLMPKKNRIAIFEYLFKEGVMVAKKDYHAPKHGELENIPNLQVIKALQSLKSKGYVKEQFAWRHYYWYLTNTGIEYLRTFLHLPAEIVPSTLKRQARTEAARPRPAAVGRSEGGFKGAEDRTGYRRNPAAPGADKKADVGAGTGELEFRAGFGRGRPESRPQ